MIVTAALKDHWSLIFHIYSTLCMTSDQGSTREFRGGQRMDPFLLLMQSAPPRRIAALGDSLFFIVIAWVENRALHWYDFWMLS